MNLTTNDLEVIKTTVRAAVAEATAELVTKTEFREFREDVRLAQTQFYPREMIDLFRKQADEDRTRLWDAMKGLSDRLDQQGNLLANIWSTTAGKVAILAGVALQLYELWSLLR